MYHSNRFAELLRENGLRATPGRVSILEALEGEKPLSIAQLKQRLKHHLNDTTLYRALEEMAKRGIVERVDFKHDHAHYELKAGIAHHHHIVCTTCGLVEDVEECDVFKLEKKVLSSTKQFSVIENHSLEFFGLCTSCSKMPKSIQETAC